MKNLTIKQKIAASLIALAAFLGGGEAILGNASAGRPENAYSFMAHATSGVATLSAGNSIMILATSSKRAYADFSTTCSTPIYLRLANSSGTTLNLPSTGGLVLSASSTRYEIDTDNLYKGAVYASSSVACTVNITEAQF